MNKHLISQLIVLHVFLGIFIWIVGGGMTSRKLQSKFVLDFICYEMDCIIQTDDKCLTRVDSRPDLINKGKISLSCAIKDSCNCELSYKYKTHSIILK